MDGLWAIMPLDFLESALCVPQFCCGALFGLGFCAYYFFEVVKIPIFVCAKGPFSDFLSANLPILKSKFWPTLWCFESRAQTIFASVIRARILPHVKYRREILTLSDGGEVALDWAEENSNAMSPIVIILPGLTGASQAEYIKCLVYGAKNSGMKCVIFNYRGMGGVKIKTPKLYCASSCEDLAEVIDHVKKLNPHISVAATGISMGGLLLGNYLAQYGRNAIGKLKAALIISVPMNIFEATKSIEKPFLNLMLNKYLCDNLQRILKSHVVDKVFPELDLKEVYKSKTVREFDENFTSRHFGYRDAYHYYSKATLHNKLHLVEVPLLCLSAADDPFQPLQAIPLKEVSASKNVAMIVTSRGGHIGFLEGFWPLKEEQYIGKIFSQYFTAVFTVGKDHPAF
ncbi:PREDICTED: abhydrolase domain-containing protein 3-like [Ceratosolen solmsi marchali]|uniref:Abhydrolase domain-containing protein 3-like n=1 Tax=Ceratosolen solmsi marchali TaxID=326594 RepID=A0AAJ6VLW3_9HYME|nr:PREDICTED: abhydrolase domain-containing protein 3-like [Ceratosolen solmsi marchali]